MHLLQPAISRCSGQLLRTRTPESHIYQLPCPERLCLWGLWVGQLLQSLSESFLLPGSKSKIRRLIVSGRHCWQSALSCASPSIELSEKTGRGLSPAGRRAAPAASTVAATMSMSSLKTISSVGTQAAMDLNDLYRQSASAEGMACL